MATDPNQILATAIPAGGGDAGNPFVPHPMFTPATPGPVFAPHSGFAGTQPGLMGLIQAARSADPNAWSAFLAQPWAQSLQQRFNLSPDALNSVHQVLTGMAAPSTLRQYFQQNMDPTHHPLMAPTPAPALPPQQVGMVSGVPGSMGTNPAAGGQGPVMQPGPVIAPPQQQQQGWRSPMLPPNMGSFAGFGGGQGGGGYSQGQHPLAGIARQPGTPGFGL